MGNTAPYALLVGVGRLYIAPAGTARPDLGVTPSGLWRDLGETDGGVKVTKKQKIEQHKTDQRTGAVKATRTEESMEIAANLLDSTLENLANVIGGAVTDTAPGSGTIGKRSMGLHAGETVNEYALLFVGDSAYGPWPGQYWIPRGFFDGDVGQSYDKGKKTMIPIKFEALEDLNASTEDERFGIFEDQDALAL